MNGASSRALALTKPVAVSGDLPLSLCSQPGKEAGDVGALPLRFDVMLLTLQLDSTVIGLKRRRIDPY
jgi:hypothetical protein